MKSNIKVVSYESSRKFKIEDDGENRNFTPTSEVENSIVLDIDGKFLRVRIDPADMLALTTTIAGTPPIVVMSIQEKFASKKERKGKP